MPPRPLQSGPTTRAVLDLRGDAVRVLRRESPSVSTFDGCVKTSEPWAMRCLLLLALAACATDPPPPERGPSAARIAREYRAASTVDDPPIVHQHEGPPPITADVAEHARQDAVAAQERAREEAATRKKAEEERAAAEAAKHASDCKASYPTRLMTLQTQLGAAVTKKAQIEGRCRTLQPRCVIGNGHSVCAGVSADDAQFYENICMILPYGDQIPVVDETSDCADVDVMPLHVTMKTTSAEVETLRRAKP